jgi:hypothetical protein
VDAGILKEHDAFIFRIEVRSVKNQMSYVGRLPRSGTGMVEVGGVIQANRNGEEGNWHFEGLQMDLNDHSPCIMPM